VFAFRRVAATLDQAIAEVGAAGAELPLEVTVGTAKIQSFLASIFLTSR